MRERSSFKHASQKAKEQEALNSRSFSDQENICHVQRNSPLFQVGKVIDCGRVSASPDGLLGKPENKDLTKMLNNTLSPIGTPERFKKLMPHIYSESSLSATVKPADDADSGLTGTPGLSIKDALVIIDSDLSHINSSPPDTSSSCSFSDSLESMSGSRGCRADNDFLKLLSDSSKGSDSSEQRLTFFVSKKVVSEVTVSEPVKKASFTSATVTKSKAPTEANKSSGRKIKKSRRRLLEKTLELSDGSSESGPGTPSLPVIDLDNEMKLCTNTNLNLSSSLVAQTSGSPTTISFPVSFLPSVAPTRFSISVASPPPTVDGPVASPLPLRSSSPFQPNLTSNTKKLSPTLSAPLSIQEELFPIHIVEKTKKRKSEEFLKSEGKVEDAGKTDCIKRSRVVGRKSESCSMARERRSVTQMQQLKTTGE